MATARCLLSEDEFQCSICLDVFTDPVTTPCGHNFCKICITQHWDVNDRYLCPMCQKIYKSRPELHINTLLSKMTSQFREEVQQEARIHSSEQHPSNPGEVPCDVCTGTKLKALKSCLVCLESYCEPHLEPHLTRPGLKRHELMDPVENLEERICMKHTKPLELFCKTDQIGVCMLCSVLDHKTHDVVPLKEEYEEKKAELGKTEAEIQQMIQKRQIKIQEIADSADLSKENADKEKAEGVQVFTGLKESVEKGLKEFINTIDKKQKTTEKQAEDFIKELEVEIYDLTTRRDEVALLSQSEDQLHLLQSFKSLKAATPYQDWTERSVHPPSRGGTLMKAVAKLEETISKEIKKVLVELELKRVQQFAVDMTFDPDTKGPKTIPGVLGKQSFSSGRFYFEVQVKDDTEWTLGVVKESIIRKEKVTLSPRNGHWTICLRNRSEYKACHDPPVRLSLETRPQKVGVFVDYEEDLVSFYDVDTAALIYSFTGCSFTEKLLPFFSPCPLLVQKEKMAEGRAADLDTQRVEVAELLVTTLKKGDIWYLVDSRWFKQWKKYVGYDNRDKYQKGDQNVYPGPVDNSGLFRDGDVLDIKEHLIDELDYVLVPTVGWNKLVSWYGLTEGQEPITRKVVEHGMFVKHCKVEVYLTELKLCEDSNMDKMITRRFSKADTIDMIEKEMRKLFNIPDQKETRLWNKCMRDTFKHLDKPEATVQNACLFQGQVIVIGQKNKDGSWPRVSRAPK